MKKISVVIPCYNEEENIIEIVKAVEWQINKYKQKYDYEIILIDNDSKDNTRNIIEDIIERDEKVKAIFNIRNFGFINSPYYRFNSSKW